MHPVDEWPEQKTVVRNLTKEEIAALNGDATKPLKREDPNRTASQQIEALLTVTDRQVQNLEGKTLLDKQDMRQLSFLADTLATLVRAQRDAAKMDEDTFDAGAEARKRLKEED